jgi:hypothetical protein
MLATSNQELHNRLFWRLYDENRWTTGHEDDENFWRGLDLDINEQILIPSSWGTCVHPFEGNG